MIAQINILDPDMEQRIGQRSISFQPGINIIVGSNGTGKSSLLEVLVRTTEGGNQAKLIWDPSVKVHHYSAEQATKERQENPENVFGAVHDSHGQALRKYLEVINSIESEAILILDEPETALDFNAVWELCKVITQKKNIQFILSTHHPLFLTIHDANFINLDRNDKNYVKTVLSKLQKRLK